MEPLNFCRQIKKNILELNDSNEYEEVKKINPAFLFHPLLDSAVKFTLPLNGYILNDAQLKGLDGVEELRLPYEHIALEFTRDVSIYRNYSPLEDQTQFPSKIVLLLVERSGYISVQMWCHTIGIWYPCSPIFIPKVDSYVMGDKGVYTFKVHMPPAELMGVNTPETLEQDYGMELEIVFGFLNALACSNVHTEKLPPRKPSKTLGSLPFDEYRVLTIDRPAGANNGHAGGNHRSPREHLRRGHIRRLPTGSKIWVNAAVINAGAGGKIRKQYALG